VFEKRAMENWRSSVYRQRNRALECSNLWLDGDSALVPHSSLTLAQGQSEIDGGIGPRLVSSVNRRERHTLTLEGAEKYADCWFQHDSTKHAFQQRHSCSGPGRCNRESGGRDATDLASVRGPVFRCKSGAGTLMPVSVAGDMLGGLGAGLAVGGPRFVQAVACTGSAGGSSGYAGPCGACC